MNFNQIVRNPQKKIIENTKHHGEAKSHNYLNKDSLRSPERKKPKELLSEMKINLNRVFVEQKERETASRTPPLNGVVVVNQRAVTRRSLPQAYVIIK